MNKNKQLFFNMISQLISFVVNFSINMVLSPYIIETVGRESYGFVSLGNNFISYVSLITIALNSMAGRFISISMNRGEMENAKQYYSSVIISNILLTAILSGPCFYFVLNINHFVKVSSEILGEVILLWLLLAVNFLLGVLTSNFGVSLFAANRIDIQNICVIGSNVLRVIVLSVLFICFTPHVWYLGISGVVCTLYLAFVKQYFGKKVNPKLSFSIRNFRWAKVKDLLSAGIWNSVSRVGSIALTELDLLLSNIFISAEAMGTLSIAKTIPNYVNSLVGDVISTLLPQLTIDYAKSTKKQFLASVRSYMRLLLFIQSIVYGLLFAFSDVLLHLWIPSVQDVDYIYFLGMITISGCFVSSISYVMTNIFTVTNKLRFSSIVVIGTGFVSLGLTYLLLKTTDLGLAAIAGVSVALVILRNIVLLIPYGAKCIDAPWYTFYPDLAVNVGVVGLSIVISFLVKRILPFSYTWLGLTFEVAVTVIVLLVTNYFIVLKKEERVIIKGTIKRKLKRR